MLKSILCLLVLVISQANFAFNNNAEVEVLRENGRLEIGILKAERVNEEVPASFSSVYMPYIEFRDGTRSLFSSRSNLVELFCAEVLGVDVFNPYRDVRMSNAEMRRFNRGLFKGPSFVRGSANREGYLEATKTEQSEFFVMSFSCSEY